MRKPHASEGAQRASVYQGLSKAELEEIAVWLDDEDVTLIEEGSDFGPRLIPANAGDTQRIWRIQG